MRNNSQKFLNVRNGLCLVILFALLLTSCNPRTQTQIQSTTEMCTSSQEETQIEEDIASQL